MNTSLRNNYLLLNASLFVVEWLQYQLPCVIIVGYLHAPNHRQYSTLHLDQVRLCGP